MKTRVDRPGRRQPNYKKENREYPDQSRRRAEAIDLMVKRNLALSISAAWRERAMAHISPRSRWLSFSY
jgi:hypothetical protein